MASPHEHVPTPASTSFVDSTPPVLVIRGRLQAADVAAIWENVGLSSAPAGRRLVCDVGALTDVDCGTVDALARLTLRARRVGCRLLLRNDSTELRGLLGLAGLTAVVPCLEESVVEARWKTEQGEELLGVEEERDPADRPSRELDDL